MKRLTGQHVKNVKVAVKKAADSAKRQGFAIKQNSKNLKKQTMKAQLRFALKVTYTLAHIATDLD